MIPNIANVFDLGIIEAIYFRFEFNLRIEGFAARNVVVLLQKAHAIAVY